MQKALIQGAETTGKVQLHLGQFISEYDLAGTRFKAKSQDAAEPEWVQADVILAADGVKSKARAAFCKVKGEVDEGEYRATLHDDNPADISVEDTGQAAYRIMVRRAAIKEDPDLIPFFEGTVSNRWIGSKRHIIVGLAYPCRIQL